MGEILCIVIAVVILIIGIIFVVTNSQKYEKITGIISRIEYESEYIPEENVWNNSTTFYVSYDYKGQSYENIRLDYSDASHSEGDTIQFYVNVNKPTEITKSPKTPLIICLILSAGFLFVGIFGIIKTKKKSATNDF